MKARTLYFVAGLAAILVLTACGAGDDPPDPTVTPVLPSPTAVTPSPELSLTEVVWTSGVAGGSGAPVDTLTTLPNTADRVVAAVQAESLPEGTTLQAHWTIDGERLPELDPEPLVVGEGRENAWIAWTLNWNANEPWPIGSLGIVIEVNGEVALSDEIFIVRSNT